MLFEAISLIWVLKIAYSKLRFNDLPEVSTAALEYLFDYLAE